MSINEKMSHPVVSWSLIVSIIGLALVSFKSINALENQINGNTLGLVHEKEFRVAAQEGLKEDLGELKQDAKDIKQDIKTQAKKAEENLKTVEKLLQQILLRQAATPLPPVIQ